MGIRKRRKELIQIRYKEVKPEVSANEISDLANEIEGLYNNYIPKAFSACPAIYLRLVQFIKKFANVCE